MISAFEYSQVVDVEVLDVLVVVVGFVGLNVSSLNSVGNDVDGTNDGWEEGSGDILGLKLGWNDGKVLGIFEGISDGDSDG